LGGVQGKVRDYPPGSDNFRIAGVLAVGTRGHKPHETREHWALEKKKTQ